MVYIKLPTNLWTLSGLQRISPKPRIKIIEDIRYISYQDFKSAAKKCESEIHSLIKRQNIISNLQMKQIIKESQKTPQQKKISEELKSRHQLRLLNSYGGKKGNYYFEDKRDQSVKDLSKSISFGLTFIFSFFLAGLTGYYFGIYFLSLQSVHALIVAVIFIIITIIIETSLYIIKQSREDQKEKIRRKKKSLYNFKSKIYSNPNQKNKQQ